MVPWAPSNNANTYNQCIGLYEYSYSHILFCKLVMTFNIDKIRAQFLSKVREWLEVDK